MNFSFETRWKLAEIPPPSSFPSPTGSCNRAEERGWLLAPRLHGLQVSESTQNITWLIFLCWQKEVECNFHFVSKHGWWLFSKRLQIVSSEFLNWWGIFLFWSVWRDKNVTWCDTAPEFLFLEVVFYCLCFGNCKTLCKVSMLCHYSTSSSSKNSLLSMTSSFAWRFVADISLNLFIWSHLSLI